MTSDSPETSLKTNRKQCYAARDAYLRCMDENNHEEKKCRVFMTDFKAKCPASWVPHFIRKHQFEKYKNQLETQGVTTADEQYEKAKQPTP
ncbi:unnamed protein product [Bursaphelenchus xylophilus]|uniref:(pine wood nematode) hypothetical protein n=1 Tax=Bursaphelenchus xylophilus TaxID=6326 RepID=A0A1I7SCL9_BURXY|nr:unnamed protein product [Bursaphelenchus xylophilus]CAG9093872.1 unnamed protein product [Bursaphelenchus xylophilus]